MTPMTDKRLIALIAILLFLLVLSVYRWEELKTLCQEPTTSMEIIFFDEMPCAVFTTEGKRSYDCNWAAFSGVYPEDLGEKVEL